jgi:hypothetical protein
VLLATSLILPCSLFERINCGTPWPPGYAGLVVVFQISKEESDPVNATHTNLWPRSRPVPHWHTEYNVQPWRNHGTLLQVADPALLETVSLQGTVVTLRATCFNKREEEFNCRAGASIGNACILEVARLESWLEQRLSWQVSVSFLSIWRQIPGRYLG